MKKDKSQQPSSHTSKEKSKPFDSEKQKKSKQKLQNSQSQFRCTLSQGQKQETKNQKQKSKNHSHESSKQKSVAAHKREAKNKQLFMKDDLKKFLKKNITGKQKDARIVPQILKKIEENCKALRQIHEKEQLKIPQRSSLMKSRDSRQHTQNLTKKGTKQQHQKQKKEKPLKINSVRHSYQLKTKHSKEQNHQKHGRKKIGKVQTEAKDQNAIMEIYKEYKKQFQIEDPQIEGKNTNYNTSQTRNSSSLVNSHQQAKIIHPKQKKTLQQIQAIIQTQKKDLQKYLPKSKPQISHSRLGVVSPIPVQSNLPSSEGRSFEQSKYYVQPIPPFRPSPLPQQSLAGCEITFIENDLLNDVSIPSLHL